MTDLTHLDAAGRARMVDVGSKSATARRAVAEGLVRFGDEAFDALRRGTLEKGDALAVARVAGIQAAKRTSEWIPLCHVVPLDVVDVDIELRPSDRTARVIGRASTRSATGVEMEALTAVTAACLALYDMAKALDRGIRIEGVRLLEKHGGKSGSWLAPGATSPDAGSSG